jgi:hypothetical protein
MRTEDREHGESGDRYDRVVVQLNEKWRVVECRAGIQWILQRRKSATAGSGWDGRSFCRSGEAIKRLARLHAQPIDPDALAVLDALPAWIEEARGDAGDQIEQDRELHRHQVEEVHQHGMGEKQVQRMQHREAAD